jgi:hypothetical protein
MDAKYGCAAMPRRPHRLGERKMALQDFQTALGLLLATPIQNGSENGNPGLLQRLDLSPEERASLSRLLPSPGFQFTAAIQRSWCERRAASAAAFTLSILPVGQRRQIVEEWVGIGGGASSFFASEADSFLEFIARRLPDPSHELTVARFEQAVQRASDAVAAFRLPDSVVCNAPDIKLRRSKSAALVYFFAEPQSIFAAMNEARPLPPLSNRSYPVLFAPGLPGLFRSATVDEAALWEKLAAPAAIQELLEDGHTRETVQGFVTIGAIENSENVVDYLNGT